MLIRQLEYFVALAREQHFGRAAAACFVSQPALSESIQKLESELGVQLVNRRRTFQGLTDEGRRILPWAQRIVADHDAIDLEIRAMRSDLVGTLGVGVIPGASSTVALLTDAFCTRHDDVAIRLETDLRSAEIIDKVRAYELDAGLVYTEGLDLEDLEEVPLYAESPVVVGDSRLLPETDQPLSWEDVGQLPLALLSPGMRGRHMVDRAFRERGITARPRIEADSVVSLISHVVRGHWVSIVPTPSLYDFRIPPSVRIMQIENPVTATMSLVTLSSRRRSTLLETFVAEARSLPLAEQIRANLRVAHL